MEWKGFREFLGVVKYHKRAVSCLLPRGGVGDDDAAPPSVTPVAVVVDFDFSADGVRVVGKRCRLGW